jgi:hypothetical protein
MRLPQLRATYNTNLDKQRMIEAAQKEYLDAQKKARELKKEAQNKAVEQTQQKQTERTVRSGKIRAMNMELAQQATERQKQAEQTLTGTAAMHNDRESAEQGLRELQQYYKDQEAGLIKERGRDRGREL